jgi:protocatechuate 3,4-dioxygenase beta subunit
MQGERMLRRRAVAIAALLAAVVPWQLALAHDEPRAARGVNVFEGRVVDHSGQPVPSATVAVACADGGYVGFSGGSRAWSWGVDDKFLGFLPKRNGRGSGQTVTDKDGCFRIERLRPGKVHLIAVHEERGIEVALNIEQPSAGALSDVVLQPPTFIEARIHGLPGDSERWITRLRYESAFPWGTAEPKEPGEGLVGPQIFIRPRLKIKEDGGCRVGPLPVGGPWALTVEQFVEEQSYRATLLQMSVTAELGKTAKLEIDLSEGEVVSGHVLGPDSKPLSGVSVAASTSAGDFTTVYGAITDEEGRYAVRGLPGGDYTLTALRHARRTRPG